jgi:hypothetical protein
VPPALQASRKTTSHDATTDDVSLGQLTSLGDTVGANLDDAGLHTTLTSCPAILIEDVEVLDSLPECAEVDSSQESDEFYAEIETAIPGEEFILTSALRVAGEPRSSVTVDFDIVHIGRYDVPEH